MKRRLVYFFLILLVITAISPCTQGLCTVVTFPGGEAVNWTNDGRPLLLAQSVTDEYSEAIAWYRRLAEEGKPEGQFYLGLMYLMGKGLPRDYEKAAMWLRKSAEQGYPDAQFELGRLYAVGNGVEQDIIQAYVLVSLAAEQGHKKAMEIGDIIASQMDDRQMAEARNLLNSLRRRK